MARRSLLRNYRRLGEAYDYMVAQQDQPIVDRTGQGTNRGPQTVLYLIPFTREVGANTKVMAKASTASWGLASGAVGNRATPTLGTDAVVSFKGFTPARVVFTTGRGGTGTVRRSRVTNLPYLYYGGQTRSVPFGKPTAASTDPMYTEFSDIVAQLRTANQTYTLQDEVAGK